MKNNSQNPFNRCLRILVLGLVIILTTLLWKEDLLGPLAFRSTGPEEAIAEAKPMPSPTKALSSVLSPQVVAELKEWRLKEQRELEPLIRTGREIGRRKAIQNIKQGWLSLNMTSRNIQPWHNAQAKILYAKYRVHLFNFTPVCIIRSQDRQGIFERHAYNELMKTEIQKRFGRDILERTAKEAERRYRLTGRDALPQQSNPRKPNLIVITDKNTSPDSQ